MRLTLVILEWIVGLRIFSGIIEISGTFSIDSDFIAVSGDGFDRLTTALRDFGDSTFG